MSTLQLFIAGTHRDAGDESTFAVTNPFTGDVEHSAAAATDADVDAAVSAARTAFDRGIWSRRSGRDRARVLTQAAALLRESVDELAEMETRQTGRPIREMRSQLARLPEWFEYFGALAQTTDGVVPEAGEQMVNIVRRRPLGVAALITPWNHPLLITTKKLSAALAAGNSVVVKPSELAPATPIRLAEILTEAGVPAGVLNVVTGLGATTGNALVRHPGIDRIDVTGGTETGRVIARAAGERLIPVTAELGGKAPVILLDDVDIDTAVAGALFASFIATGQTCVQGAKLLVHRDVADEVIARLRNRTCMLRLGDPLDVTTQIGPLVSAAQRKHVADAVDRARGQGATILSGGRAPAGPTRGWFYEPTIVTDVDPTMDIWHEEIFGPVVVVDTFDSDDAAIAKANDSTFGLAASIWTRDIARAIRMRERLDIGIVWINDHHRVDPASPWGGTKDSGIGVENSREAYLNYTRPHSTLLRTSGGPFDWFASTEDLRYS